MKVISILSLLGLSSNQFSVLPEIVEDNDAIYIYLVLKDEDRTCPFCNGHNVVIKETKRIKIKHSVVRIIGKPVYLIVTKRKYLCKDCRKIFTQTLKLVKKGHVISNDIRKLVLEMLKDVRSFSSIGKELKISEPTVRNIFNENIKAGRKALTTAICIDEKKFKTEDSKYVCIITDPNKNEILDVVKSRKSAYLNDYFYRLKDVERGTVRFFISDMYEGYRSVKKNFFPNAIHIIDHFHVSRLFTNVLQIIRKQVMKEYKFDEQKREYKFLKRNWKIFLINPYNASTKLETSFEEPDGEVIDLKEKVNRMLKSYPEFLEIYNLYADYCHYLKIGLPDDELKNNMDFIINKSLNSTNPHIRTIGNTLLNFYEEILNYFLSKNSYRFSNANAENINSKIEKLIIVSHGITDFETFRKRLLYIR